MKQRVHAGLCVLLPVEYGVIPRLPDDGILYRP